jgi:hypothetical protein
MESLSEYDCIFAIDPDWTRLDTTQVEHLMSWVADEAGGMIVVAGPVNMQRWLKSSEHAGLKSLYPVEFQERLSLLDDGHFAGKNPWPIEFERAGEEARFLWLANSADETAEAWAQFEGVYGYYAVKGAKRGATVFGRFSDPEAGLSDERPIYLAGHFYGAGQVLYLGSAELWRLRTLDPSYFEVLATQLVRHVSQGRLLRGAGVSLLVERDRYDLGENVVLRAKMSSKQQDAPAVAITAHVIAPDGSVQIVKLNAEPNIPGAYLGQFVAIAEGTYEIALANFETDPHRIRVRMPDIERAKPQRDVAVLAEIASLSGGRYFAELETAVHGYEDTRPLADLIADRTEVKLIEGAPDEGFDRRQMQWLLGMICGSLLLEWTLRRLLRLA